MLSKKNRTDKNNIAQIFKDGRYINSDNLTFKFILKKNSDTPAISFLTPKNVSKSAVKRNHLRRCGYKALEKHFSLSPFGLTGVFIFRKYQDDILILENEIKNILHKVN